MKRVGRKGQSILYAVLLMPMLFLVLALAIDMAALQLERLRLHYAADLAALSGAAAVDAPFFARTGALRLDPASAAATTREYLSRNLALLPDTPDPGAVAAQAEIAIVNQVPGHDPYSSQLLDRPSVCLRLRVPERFGFLGWTGLWGGTIVVTANAEIRT